MNPQNENRKNPAGIIMTTVGGILGMAGIVAWLIGFKITITPGMQELLFYKGLFAGSFGLMAVGAIIGRRLNANRRADETRALEQNRALNESAPAFEDLREREKDSRTV